MSRISILVSFDVEFLITKVLVRDALELLKDKFLVDIENLFEHLLCNDSFYEQRDGIFIGSLLSPMVANFFMESFEQEALRTAPYQLKK